MNGNIGALRIPSILRESRGKVFMVSSIYRGLEFENELGTSWWELDKIKKRMHKSWFMG